MQLAAEIYSDPEEMNLAAEIATGFGDRAQPLHQSPSRVPTKAIAMLPQYEILAGTTILRE